MAVCIELQLIYVGIIHVFVNSYSQGGVFVVGVLCGWINLPWEEVQSWTRLQLRHGVVFVTLSKHFSNIF